MTALHGQYSDPSSHGLWQSLNRFLGTLIVVTVATIIVYRYLPELSKRRDQEARIEALRAEIDHQKQILTRRTREEYLLKHDPEYIGMIARDRLDLMQEGDVIYRQEPVRPDPAKMRLNR